MYKLIIADDEPKIRRGIERLIDWDKYGIEIVAEAEDGEIAYEMIIEKKPQIALLDINMPFLNGLELIEKVRKVNQDIIIIIITGYDDFKFAQQAVKLKVFDYILKPVKKSELEELIEKAVNEAKITEEKNKSLYWTSKYIKNDLETFKQAFFGQWINEKLSDDEFIKEMEFVPISFNKNIGILVIKGIEDLQETVHKIWNNQLLDFAIQNIVNEDFKTVKNKLLTIDDNFNIVIVVELDDTTTWIKYGDELKNKINSYLKFQVIIEQDVISDGILKVKEAYQRICKIIKKKKNYSKLVLAAINYIEKNYYLNDISVNIIANELEVSSSYLSKRLKQETGLSFVDFTTAMRIKKAKGIMKDLGIKLYDVAELVGYSNQYYFSRAFKKVTGVSPKEYQGGK